MRIKIRARININSNHNKINISNNNQAMDKTIGILETININTIQHQVTDHPVNTDNQVNSI